MRRSVPLSLYALIVVTLLLSSLPPVAVAQPAPQPQCAEGEVLVPEENICVPEGEAPLPAPTEAPPTPTPLPEGNLASFTLYHLACDDDFDPNGVRDAGGLGPANGCLTFGKPPFAYTISANGIPITSATLDATERDFARFDETAPIPAGTLTIAVVPVAPYTTEFISCGLEVGEAGTDVIEPPIAGGSATFSTLPDQKVECWVYNVNRQPVVQEQDPGEDEVVGDGNSVGTVVVDTSGTTGAAITIAAYLCPAGVTATDDLIAACTQRASGLEFSLLTETETLETQTSDAEGDIFYSGVPANDYGIAAALPPGYGEPIVICYVADPLGNVVEEQRDVVFGNQIRLRLGDGFNAECAWYNVPDQGSDNGPNVFIQARKCGPGTQITASMTVAEAEQLCVVVYPNQTFQIQFDNAPIATKATNDDPLSPGQAFFTRLPAPNGGGVYGITAAVLEGERTLGVFCDQNYGGDRFVSVTTIVIEGNRIDQELLEGWTLRCSWFIEINPLLGGTQVASQTPALDPTSIATTEQAAAGTVAPAPAELDPTSQAATEAAQLRQPGITVLARFCPPEVVTQRVILADVCIVPAVGVTFDVAIDGEASSTQVTGESGDLAIPLGVVGPATYQIATRLDPGLSDAQVSCAIVHADGAMEQVGGTVPAGSPGQEIAFDGASEVTCTFYFLGEVLGSQPPPEGDAVAPPEDPGIGAAAAAGEDEVGSEVSWEPGITVQARLCPADVAGQDLDVDLTGDCTEPANGITFEVLVDDASTGTYVTDANGEFVIPAELGPGAYLFRHQPAADQLELKTVCSSVYENGATATSQSRAVGSEMSELYLTYDGASSTICTFYIVLDSAAPEGQASPAAGVTEGVLDDQGTADGAPHALTVLFWTCPAGTDPAADQVDLMVSCSSDTAKRSLTLAIDGDAMEQTVTGSATWEYVEPPIAVDIGPGLVSSAWCSTKWVEIGEETIDIPDTVALDGGVLTLAVAHPATTATCDWFLFPD